MRIKKKDGVVHPLKIKIKLPKMQKKEKKNGRNNNYQKGRI